MIVAKRRFQVGSSAAVVVEWFRGRETVTDHASDPQSSTIVHRCAEQGAVTTVDGLS